jgi:diguanylate cyclase (GGDEF)-like protein/PAS domain S-box-containing protein
MFTRPTQSADAQRVARDQDENNAQRRDHIATRAVPRRDGGRPSLWGRLTGKAVPLRVRPWSAYLAGISVLTTAYVVGHFVGLRWLNSGPVYNVIGGSAAVALIVGVRKNSQDRRLPWYLFALAQAFFVTGDVLAYNYERFFGGALPFPSIADGFYLAVGPLLVAGLLMLVRDRNETRSPASLIDALIITVAAAALSWVYLMAPYAHDHTLKLTTKLTSIAYPLADILILGVLLRMAVGSRRRGLAFGLLVCGTGALLLTDTIYGWKLLHGGYNTGGVLDAGWAMFYGFLGAAALHPSMRKLAERAPDPGDRLTTRRLALLTCATLTAPILLIARGSAVGSLDGHVLVGASITLFALVLLRMTGLVHRNEEAVRSEAALRIGGEALVTAVGREEIYSATLQTARSLVREDVTVRLCLNDRSDGPATVSGSDVVTLDNPALRLDELPATVRGRLDEHRVVTFERSGENVFLAQLSVQGEVVGYLFALSPRRLRRAAEESLATLATAAALALQSAVLSEEAAHQRSEARLSSLVKNASDVICILAEDGGIHYVSPSVQGMLGYLPSVLTGDCLADIVEPNERTRVLAFIAATAARPAGQPHTVGFRMRHAERGWRDVEALATNLLGDEAIGGIVLNIRDVTERKAFEAELEHRAFHDTLTGLANRALFRNRLEHALAGQGRDRMTVAVLFVDVDDLKDVNDSLGHAAGDKVLREVGRRLDGCMRGVDTAARISGDEFAVLINGSDSETDSIEIARRVINALAVTLTLEGKQVPIAASMGIAFNSGGGSARAGAEELMRDADAAMYMAKRSGKGGYEVFHPEMHAQALARLELKGDLQRAIEANEFTVRYQPIMDLARHDIAGMEALARWEHPIRGTVSPDEFIPLVEQSGLIVPLGRHVLREACRQAVLLQNECPREPALSISVNVSAFQLQRPEFIDEAREVLQETRIEPSSLILELTESVLMRNMDLSISRMNALRSLGVRLAIDDFGTGYSSLVYLRTLPVNILKLDRSFLADESAQATRMITAVVELARIFNLQSVVEGIESDASLARLRDAHCDFGQGFYFAKPLSGEDLMTFALQSRVRGASGAVAVAVA